jgi:signal peptidase
MCTVKGIRCDGWFHPFSPTLHTGDLIVVQGVNPKEIKTSPYPYGDVIVFQQTKAWENSPDDLIVHRAIESEVNPNNGMIYFETKGDANSGPDHHDDYRGENYSWNGMVSEKLVVGKVIFRIPWIGHIALFMHNSSGISIILFLIIIIVIMFIIPAFKGKEAEAKQEENLENALET